MYELKKNGLKFQEELICHFKTDMRNSTNVDPSTGKTKKLAFERASMTKVYNV